MKTPGEWKATLRHVLDHLYEYLLANVHTDQVHTLMLQSALASAHRALQEDDDFWPGYAEGLTRFALLLMGDYPDHRRNRPGVRSAGHFDLNRMRTPAWGQDPKQKLNTLIAAHALGAISTDPLEALREFRREHGFQASYRDFLEWYRQRYAQEYATVF